LVPALFHDFDHEFRNRATRLKKKGKRNLRREGKTNSTWVIMRLIGALTVLSITSTPDSTSFADERRKTTLPLITAPTREEALGVV